MWLIVLKGGFDDWLKYMLTAVLWLLWGDGVQGYAEDNLFRWLVSRCGGVED